MRIYELLARSADIIWITRTNYEEFRGDGILCRHASGGTRAHEGQGHPLFSPIERHGDTGRTVYPERQGRRSSSVTRVAEASAPTSLHPWYRVSPPIRLWPAISSSISCDALLDWRCGIR